MPMALTLTPATRMAAYRFSTSAPPLRFSRAGLIRALRPRARWDHSPDPARWCCTNDSREAGGTQRQRGSRSGALAANSVPADRGYGAIRKDHLSGLRVDQDPVFG